MADDAVVGLLQEIRDLRKQHLEQTKIPLANQQQALANQQQSIDRKQLLGRTKANWIVLMSFLGAAIFLSVFFSLLSVVMRFIRQN